MLVTGMLESADMAAPRSVHFHGHSPAGHLVRQLRRLFITASIGHGNSDADGIQVDLRHEHEAPLQRQQRRAHQQHHRRPQHHSLVPQGP